MNVEMSELEVQGVASRLAISSSDTGRRSGGW